MATSVMNRGEKAKSPSKELLRNWTKELIERYPDPPMGELEADGLRDALKQRLDRVGEQRLKRSIQRCILENPNYGKRPTLQQIDDRIPASMIHVVTDGKCPDCSGSGWAKTQKDNPDSPVRRCHCWRKDMA